MVKLLKSFKTEIHPTKEQKDAINRTIGTCRYVYNFYIARNMELYKSEGKFITGRDFSVWLNNEFVPNSHEHSWIKSVSSKSVKRSIENACTAFLNFFHKKGGFPKFKKKGRSDAKMYFVRNNPTDCLCERHRIKIPTLGWVRLKEKGYLPASKKGYVIRSGTVSARAGRCYVSVLADVPCAGVLGEYTDGIGIDLGIKNFAAVSNGMVLGGINKTKKVRKLERKIRREQKSLSRRYQNKKKGESAQGKNIDRQRLRVQRLCQRLDAIRTDYINKAIAGMVKTKPSCIAVEDLNVRGMMKNRHLSMAVASQKFYEFRKKLEAKCRESGIELRIVGRFYPSSKMCHNCGCIKRGLKLSERVYKCEKCGCCDKVKL